MKLVYRIWWRTLMELRPVLSFLAERFPRLAPWAIRSRSVCHGVVGNPAPVILGIWCLAAWQAGAPGPVSIVGAAVAVVLVEAVHRVLFETGRGGWLVGWREGWRVHRVLPSLWARTAAKTMAVQAEVGTSKEPVASARLRPIVDHPKMGWWPTIEWPQVSWWLGPPPGRSFDKFAEVLDVLAANYSRCVGMELDYDKPTDAYARLTVSFGSVLDNTVEPVVTVVDAQPWTPTIVAAPDAAEPRRVPGDADSGEGWTPVVVDGVA